VAAATSPTITDAKVLKTIGSLQAVAQAQTARAAAYRAAAASYARRAAKYATVAPSATAAPTATATANAVNAQRARIQNEQRAIAAAGEQLASRADAAAAAASLRSIQLQQQAALTHTP
jgi:hypothetical protein